MKHLAKIGLSSEISSNIFCRPWKNWYFPLRISLINVNPKGKLHYVYVLEIFDTKFYSSIVLKRFTFNKQKQTTRGVLRKKFSKNMQIYRRTLMPKCDFNKVTSQLYWNHTSVWVFSCKFAAYFQDKCLQEHPWRTASEWVYSRVPNKRLLPPACCFFKNFSHLPLLVRPPLIKCSTF